MEQWEVPGRLLFSYQGAAGVDMIETKETKDIIMDMIEDMIETSEIKKRALAQLPGSCGRRHDRSAQMIIC